MKKVKKGKNRFEGNPPFDRPDRSFKISGDSATVALKDFHKV
jgi:hypothetical protein